MFSFKKGDQDTSRTIDPLVFCHTVTKYLKDCDKLELTKTLNGNQKREQAGFRKGFSTSDHQQALIQIIEKWNEYKLPLCITVNDYEKVLTSQNTLLSLKLSEKLT